MADEIDHESATPPPAQTSKRRKRPAPAPVADVHEDQASAETETPAEDAMAAIMAVAPDEPVAEPETVSEELHEVASLMAAARSLFEVAPEVLAGAIHAGEIDPTSSITIGQARAALDTYLKQSI